MISERVVSVSAGGIETTSGWKNVVGNRYVNIGDMVYVDNGFALVGNQQFSSYVPYVPSGDKLEGFIKFDVSAGKYKICSLKEGFPALAEYAIKNSDWQSGWLVYNQDHFAFIYFEQGQIRIRDYTSGAAVESTITLPDNLIPQSKDAYYDDNGDLNWAVLLFDTTSNVCKIIQYKNTEQTTIYDYSSNLASVNSGFASEVVSTINQKYNSMHLTQERLAPTEDPGVLPTLVKNGDTYYFTSGIIGNFTQLKTAGWTFANYAHTEITINKPTIGAVSVNIDITFLDLWLGKIDFKIYATLGNVLASTCELTSYFVTLHFSDDSETHDQLKYWTSTVQYGTDFYKKISLPTNEVTTRMNCDFSLRAFETYIYGTDNVRYYETDYVAIDTAENPSSTLKTYTITLAGGTATITQQEQESGSDTVTLTVNGTNYDVSAQMSSINFNQPPLVAEKNGVTAFLSTTGNDLYRILQTDRSITNVPLGYLYNLQFPVIKISKAKFKKLFGW